MNVGLITFHRAQNAGAVLQAFALQRVIQGLGHRAKFIDYYPAVFRQNRIFHPGTQPRTILRNLYALAKFRSLRHLRDQYRVFLQRQLRIEGKQYSTPAELSDAPPEFEVYLCGSDQVWNPQMDADTGKPYFLGFAPSEHRRIAYAPSFGVTQIPPSLQHEMAQRISKIDFLSVRETQGQVIIQQLTGRDAVLALDPTLLVSAEEWSKISTPRDMEHPYILIYGAMTEQLSKSVIRVKRATGMKAVAIYSGLRPIPIPGVDYVLRDVGPTQFVWLFQNADYTIVNTFHGTAFSIINRTPFLATPANNPSRIVSLLDILGLSAHLLSDVESVKQAQITDLMNSNIDSITTKLRAFQQNSLDFLETALTP